MLGRGQFVGDMRMEGMIEVAFLGTIVKPPGHEDSVFVHADLDGVRPIVADSGVKGFKSSAQPVLADRATRQEGTAASR